MKKNVHNHTIVFYNVENLYDTIDNKGVKDSDFTPGGAKHWTQERLEKKLVDLATTLDNIHSKHPIIVGLTEVENREVARQLMEKLAQEDCNYKLLHQDSLDVRGIDLCLIYDSSFVTYISHLYLRIDFPWNTDIKTRDVLFFECEINQEKLWVVVNHWPSRRSSSSDKKRNHVAKAVRARLDEIIRHDPDVKILVLGDFNDEPNDLSLERYLKAKRTKNIDNEELYNLATELHEKGVGTCVHDGEWLMIDQVLINRNLLQNKNDGISIKRNEMHIHAPASLLFHKRDYSQPDHTYSGDKYEGGISDHLPVYVKLS